MLKNLPLYIKLPLLCGIIYTISTVYSSDRGFKSILLHYIESHVLTDETKIDLSSSYTGSSSDEKYLQFTQQSSSSVEYQNGDWEKYIIRPLYPEEVQYDKLRLYDDDDIDILSYGSIKLNLNYGGSLFTKDKYRQFDEDRPVSKVINSGFIPEQEMLIHMEGRIGRRITVYIDHDSRKEDNHYLMQYRAVRDDEVIREINAGEIDINFNYSKYAIYDNTSTRGMGVDFTLKKDKFQIKAFGSVTRGETEVEIFRGNSSPSNYKLSEFQYTKRTYYQLEPFKRYDNMTAVPGAVSAYASNTVTSSQTCIVYPVNINPAGFELYIDDQDPYNNYNAIQLSVDNGNYTKLVSGADYTINYSTGLIRFIKDIPAASRIFAVYTLRSGSTSDPCVLLPADPNHPGGSFSGKIFVFIKYGYSIDEDGDTPDLSFTGSETDKNSDGKVNIDIYEVRSFYFIGDRQILSNNFRIQFFNENRVMTKTETDSLGGYSIDYAEGIIKFTYREPFKSLNSAVYFENQSENTYVDSRYSIKVDYYRKARSFQLKHANIIPNSIRIKINGREILSTLYSIDYTSGFLMFTNPDNPQIGPGTEIEVRYEYLPFDSQSQEFIGGIRTDYTFNRNLNIGGSLLFTRSSGSEIIPLMENIPTQTLLLEGDASIHLGEKKLASFVNLFSKAKRESVPFEINAYGEYAKSYKNVNTFGKALIDNMESTEEIVFISMSEKDWILSSMPDGSTQGDRGKLYYYFYRSPSDPESLRGISYNAVSVDYSVKPGPYNVATGHIADSIEDEKSQLSLVLDFDFTGGDYLPIVTRRLSDGTVDFSGLQYVEISYRYEGETSSDQVDLSFDIGRIDEDSDGDSILDTEDSNLNGYLDTDPNAGFSEDTGYEFNGNNSTVVGSGPGLNSITRGDGILNSEDLNGNGGLDTAESVYSISGSDLTLSHSGSSWQIKRIYINRSILAQSDINLLKEAESIRLNINKNNADRGKLFIDSVKFVSSRWSNLEKEDGNPAAPDELSVTIINSLNDSGYRSEAFLFSEKDIYKSLYGEKSDSELSRESESALQIEYSVPALNNNVSVTRRFSKAMDLRFYKTMNLWFNYRSYQPGDQIGIRIGSSETDYAEYRFSMDYTGIWREIELKLKDGSRGDVDIYSTTGNPDMKRITYIKLIIYASPTNSGTIWLNDIYVSEPETLESSAYWCEGEIKITRPVFRTKNGTPVLSDIHIKYIQKGHGAQFSTVGMNMSDISEEYKELFTSMKILPNWDTRFDFIKEDSETESLNEEVIETKRGRTSVRSFFIVSDYASNMNGVPSIKLSYKNNNYRNYIDEYITSYQVNRRTDITTHTPIITIKEVIKNFLWGKFSTRIFMDMFFKKEDIDRNSSELSLDNLSTLASTREEEKRQKSEADLSIDYRNRFFYFQPSFGIGSEEIVEFYGKTELNDGEILSEINGGFHFPFVYNDDFKFVERNKRAGLIWGLAGLTYLSPVYKVDVHYHENRFRDYDDNEILISEDFTRSKDARSFISTGIDIPINLNKFKNLKFVKGFNLSYLRSVYLFESDIPYEGEDSNSFHEEYGIKRSLNGLMGAGMNIFKYYPGYFFVGRKNHANGRDYIYSKFNDSIYYPAGEAVANYNNQLRMINNFSLNCTFDFKILSFNTGAGLNQVCERQNIYGIPQQIITRSLDINFTFYLMNIFSFGFFRPNNPGIPYHSANLDLGYSYNNNMLITSNIAENSHSPSFGLTLKWDRSNFGFNAGIDFRQKNDQEYISTDSSERNSEDDKYIENMPPYEVFKERDIGYKFSALYETDVKWLYNYFSKLYKLAAYPIFSLEYSMLLNRYNYTKTVSPEPYDLHLITCKLIMDLHKNIQGGISTRWALERFRNRETSGISREVLSYEFGMNFSLIF